MLEMKTLKVAQGFSEPTINLWIFHCLQIVDCISGIASKSPILKAYSSTPFKRASNIFNLVSENPKIQIDQQNSTKMYVFKNKVQSQAQSKSYARFFKPQKLDGL